MRVARARNLTAADVTGASDPYVVAFVCAMRDSSSMEATVVGEAEEAAGNNKPSAGPSSKVIHKSLVDDDSVAKRRGEVRTKAAEDTIDPEWNETLVLNTVTKRECVCLRVKDFDSYGDGGDSDDKLGGLTLSLEEVLSYAADAGGGDASGASVGDDGSAGMGRWLRLEGEGAGDGELCIRFEQAPAAGVAAKKSAEESQPTAASAAASAAAAAAAAGESGGHAQPLGLVPGTAAAAAAASSSGALPVASGAGLLSSSDSDSDSGFTTSDSDDDNGGSCGGGDSGKSKGGSSSDSGSGYKLPKSPSADESASASISSSDNDDADADADANVVAAKSLLAQADADAAESEADAAAAAAAEAAAEAQDHADAEARAETAIREVEAAHQVQLGVPPAQLA